MGGGSEPPTEGTTDVLDVRVAKAMSHPLRARILDLLRGNDASPRELAAQLDAP